MARVAVLIAVLGTALTGCTSTTRVLDQTDRAAVARVHADVRGHRAEVVLVSGERSSGRVRFVRTDSVMWEGDERRAVPTSTVRSIVADVRCREAARGALGGAGVGTALGLLFVVSNEAQGTYDTSVAVGTGVLVVAVGAAVGAAGGAARARRFEYVFVAGPPGPAE